MPFALFLPPSYHLGTFTPQPHAPSLPPPQARGPASPLRAAGQVEGRRNGVAEMSRAGGGRQPGQGPGRGRHRDHGRGSGRRGRGLPAVFGEGVARGPVAIFWDRGDGQENTRK